ncbi:hypothetical protein SNEBB_007441 [Seison nebaliae]|nr:hypothetical protein SNEBB_007441 [Seison nebaliae]
MYALYTNVPLEIIQENLSYLTDFLVEEEEEINVSENIGVTSLSDLNIDKKKKLTNWMDSFGNVEVR